MNEWAILVYPLTRAENRCWDHAMTRCPSWLVHEMEVSFVRSWLVEVSDVARVLIALRLRDQGVLDLENGWILVPREAAREVRETLHFETGNWMISRQARFRSARARDAWEALF